jgi:hypothetical protein
MKLPILNEVSLIYMLFALYPFAKILPPPAEFSQWSQDQVLQYTEVCEFSFGV